MRVCYKCGKVIKGNAVFTSPPVFMIRLGIDSSKAYHPKCYEKAEKEAAKELQPQV
uniref:Uncharacterized protein n=1 Tax=viral metagenome TaxID=1070528 RepID=A0A6M3XPY2_9ZZZZ